MDSNTDSSVEEDNDDEDEAVCVCGCCSDTSPDIPMKCCGSSPCLGVQDKGMTYIAELL